MYQNLSQYVEEKVKSNFLGYVTDQLSIADGERLETFLRTALRQAGELTVEATVLNKRPSTVAQALDDAEAWLNKE